MFCGTSWMLFWILTLLVIWVPSIVYRLSQKSVSPSNEYYLSFDSPVHHNISLWASNEESDQPAHPRSLIRVFVVRMIKLCTLGYPKCAQGRFWWDCADAQADLSFRRAHMFESTFSEAASHIFSVSSFPSHTAGAARTDKAELRGRHMGKMTFTLKWWERRTNWWKSWSLCLENNFSSETSLIRITIHREIVKEEYLVIIMG